MYSARFCRSMAMSFCLISLIMAVATSGPVLAWHSHWHQSNPHLNRLHRSLGLWWSDGYHAAGSPQSWAPHPAARPWQSYSPSVIIPSWTDPEPITVPYRAVPAVSSELRSPQAQLRRLPPVTR
jgi:hypothetical protein